MCVSIILLLYDVVMDNYFIMALYINTITVELCMYKCYQLWNVVNSYTCHTIEYKSYI